MQHLRFEKTAWCVILRNIVFNPRILSQPQCWLRFTVFYLYFKLSSKSLTWYIYVFSGIKVNWKHNSLFIQPWHHCDCSLYLNVISLKSERLCYNTIYCVSLKQEQFWSWWFVNISIMMYNQYRNSSVQGDILGLFTWTSTTSKTISNIAAYITYNNTIAFINDSYTLY